MSLLEMKLSLEEPGMRTIETKAKKSEVEPSKLEEAQRGGEKRPQGIDKLIKVEKGLFPFNEALPNFIFSSIKAFGWNKFFTGETKANIELYDLSNDANYPRHEIITKPTKRIAREVLNYQLAWHRIGNYANRKISIAFNLGAIIQGAILAWMEIPKGAKSFPSMMEKLYLKHIPSLAMLPQRKIPSRVYNQTTLNRVITFHQNKEEEYHLKTLGHEKEPKGMEDKEDLPLPLPMKRTIASTSMQLGKKLKVDATKQVAKENNSTHCKKVTSLPGDELLCRPSLFFPLINLPKTKTPPHLDLNEPLLVPKVVPQELIALPTKGAKESIPIVVLSERYTTRNDMATVNKPQEQETQVNVDDPLSKEKHTNPNVAGMTSSSMSQDKDLKESFVKSEGDNLYDLIGATICKPTFDYFE
ncbi:hypothetical protein E5676_scaffold469G00170 [Cucumis melo var. makuwa]|uniref:Uncharacterized protein n=1 Tax=Cucumis melo var. makuwa TaxID=1194695 RepID=A0A5D3BEA4_CUCMM|nr:hypothetical protein E5676_scaffold469G00170 [Cucumis melo var. makuwa]